MKEQNHRQAENKKRVSPKSIQHLFFRTQLVLIISLALILGIACVLINIQFETEKRDQNLQNVAEAIARSPLLADENPDNGNSTVVSEYLDTLKETLDDIDVISVVNTDNVRMYHSNHTLIGTKYDGNLPEFDKQSGEYYYTVDETGPSGSQRRAYAAIYNEDNTYAGFVMAIMLTKNIEAETVQMLFIFLLITVVTILIELLIAGELSGKVKKSLMGYEPDIFTAMYKMRDNILETLEEGILAVDENGVGIKHSYSVEELVAVLAEAEKSLMADVMSEMNDAVTIAAEERGISIVFDMDGGSVPYMVRGLAVDLTSAVILLLGTDEEQDQE